jgi:hypothetical protein
VWQLLEFTTIGKGWDPLEETLEKPSKFGKRMWDVFTE